MIGSILGERYEILEKIGDGGMSLVYRARDLQERRTVAVKVLRPEHVSDEDFIRRFRREAEATQRLKHPHLVELYDISVDQEPYYLVMEYVSGPTLYQLITEEQLSFERVIYLALQITDGLQFAHEHLIIHRDIKPQNVLITDDDFVKIADFGIAVLVSTTTIVNTRSVIGSVHYLSPEQARGEAVTEQSDLYSLGVVLYEMITGQVPFDGDNLVAIVYKHDNEEPIPLSEWRPDIPGSLEDIVIRLLEKDAKKRYRSAQELREDLEALIEELPELSGSTLLDRLRRSLGKHDRNQHRQRQNRMLMRWLITFLLFVCVLGGVLFGAWQYFFPQRETRLMPRIVGMQLEKAIEELSASGFTYRIIDAVYDSKVEAGSVTYQDIEPGVQAYTNKEVGLKVCLGKQPFAMPDVTGRSQQQAVLELKAKDLEAVLKTENSSTVAEGTVIRQEPEADSIISAETEVILIISGGLEKVPMPDVKGLTFDQAREELMKFDLRPDTPNTSSDSTYPAGRIVKQVPAADDMVAKNTRVELWVNPTRTQVETTVVFESEPDVQVIRVEVEDAAGNIKVISQTEYKANHAPITLTIPVEAPAMVRVYRNDVLVHQREVR